MECFSDLPSSIQGDYSGHQCYIKKLETVDKYIKTKKTPTQVMKQALFQQDIHW